jgi:hypothetical protein
LPKKLKAQILNCMPSSILKMIGVQWKEIIWAYITGFDKSNIADKINEYTGKKYDWFSPKKLNINYFTRSDNYSLRTFKVPCPSVSTFDFENFEFYHHVSDDKRWIFRTWLLLFRNYYLL